MPTRDTHASARTPPPAGTHTPQPRDGLRRHPCRCLWRGSAHTTKTTPRRRTILHLSQMRRTLARTFILAIVATVAYAFNGNEESAGKPSTIETFPPDPQGGGAEAVRNHKKRPIPPKTPPRSSRALIAWRPTNAHPASGNGSDSPGPGARVRTSGPLSVMAIVCSKWALG